MEKLIAAGILVAGVFVLASFSPGSRLVAQQPACLHGQGESAAEQARRRQGLTTARRINSAEATAFARSGGYLPLTTLPGGSPAVAEGFVAHLSVDAAGYAFSIKDSTDPCGFAFFSDQTGTIYQGEALR